LETSSTSGEVSQIPSGKSTLLSVARRFPLTWSHYVRLLKVEKPEARRFYETEALRGGWSVRQLDRQAPGRVLETQPTANKSKGRTQDKLWNCHTSEGRPD
jgi:hypothetical protein